MERFFAPEDFECEAVSSAKRSVSALATRCGSREFGFNAFFKHWVRRGNGEKCTEVYKSSTFLQQFIFSALYTEGQLMKRA